MSPRRSRVPSPIRLRTAGAAALYAILLVSAVIATSKPSQAGPGRWSPPRRWSQIAVHMALLPGDGSPYHSRVIWWVDEDAKAFYGGQWGWRADSDRVDCSSYPEVKFDSLALDSPGVNIFCAGLGHLQDGRLLVVGGTQVGTEDGLRSTSIFAPGTGTNKGAWASPAPDPMLGRRWYATASELMDGRGCRRPRAATAPLRRAR